MHTFALIRIEQVKGKINFYKLEIDGKCEFNEFCEALENADEKKALNTIYATMDSVANLKFLPRTKFRELKGRRTSDKVKDYEIKKDAIRIYLFKDDKGYIVVFGGSKNNQKEDIARLRRLKVEYIKNN
ncbi:MAG: hypothetical protein MUC93_03930 [Bacteroidales bacterium]|jgi:hypothetical protein|nr:hypothetical protein [Bacteroidales bacterium]